MAAATSIWQGPSNRPSASQARKAVPGHDHRFIVDDTLLTLSALRLGVGLAYLPCFMGDTAPELARFCDPDEAHDLGLWLLYHPDLRRTRRVRVFRQHMINEIAARRDLFEGRQPQA